MKSQEVSKIGEATDRPEWDATKRVGERGEERRREYFQPSVEAPVPCMGRRDLPHVSRRHVDELHIHAYAAPPGSSSGWCKRLGLPSGTRAATAVSSDTQVALGLEGERTCGVQAESELCEESHRAVHDNYPLFLASERIGIRHPAGAVVGETFGAYRTRPFPGVRFRAAAARRRARAPAAAPPPRPRPAYTTTHVPIG